MIKKFCASFLIVIVALLFAIHYNFTYEPILFEKQVTLKYWHDYSHQHICHPTHFHQPSTEEEIIQIIKKVNEKGEKIKVVGAGHAMSSIAMTDGHLMNLDKYAKVLNLDMNKKQIKVQAGMRLKQLNKILDAVGLAMSNLGQIQEQSIAGATQTGTHGTGIHFGSLSTQIVELELIIANGTVIRASKDENEDIFNAARVGLGALGVVSTVTLQLEDAFHLRKIEGPMNIDDILSNVTALNNKHEHFRFWWIPGTKMGKIIILDRTKEPVTPIGPIKRWFDKNLKIQILCSIVHMIRNFPSIIYPVLNLLSPIIAESTNVVGVSHEMYTGVVPETYTEMEYFVPIEKFEEAHKAFQNYVLQEGHIVNFINENRFIKKDDIWLSPFYKRDSAALSLIMYKRHDAFPKFAKGAEELFKKFGGRPHWGKEHYRSFNDLKDEYEKIEDFKKLRKELDEKGIFLNDYLKNVLGE